MSATPTPEEIKKVREYECAIYGHDYDVIVVVGYNVPAHVLCSRCERTWAVHRGLQPKSPRKRSK